MFWKQGRGGLGHVAGPQALERAIAAQSDRALHPVLQDPSRQPRLFRSAAVRPESRRSRTWSRSSCAICSRPRADLKSPRRVPFAPDGRWCSRARGPDEELALNRLSDAYAAAGLAQAEFAFEPLGRRLLARARAKPRRNRAGRRFRRRHQRFRPAAFFAAATDGLEAEALAHGGCGVAGDSFDYRLIDHVISPRLGKGATYRSLEKILPLPAYFHAAFAQWHQISWLKTSKTLGELRRFAEDSGSRRRIGVARRTDRNGSRFRALSSRSARSRRRCPRRLRRA